ncbi:hypothetical protein EJ08DRAFT_645942 [Tothia fuscella]|uniref:Uncharacterized protein n=1 Tax=Tothia fuscella TaxID=1048955 RepID=A0A9P4P0G4_9PEZI|nr:hypothetical protein EJ08DRAFT_645942 [Tothia fuscella]
MARQKNDLEACKGELAGMVKDIDMRKKELDGQEARLRGRENNIDKWELVRSEELKEREAKVQQNEKSNKDQRIELAMRECDIAERVQGISGKEAELAEREVKLEKCEASFCAGQEESKHGYVGSGSDKDAYGDESVEGSTGDDNDFVVVEKEDYDTDFDFMNLIPCVKERQIIL